MNIFDKDLYSIQEARVLAEAAGQARQILSEYKQDQLDRAVFSMLSEIKKYIPELARMSYDETGFGRIEDKVIKDSFICEALEDKLKGMTCVGIISEDDHSQKKIGVPIGIISAFPPATSPVSTTVFMAVTAIKSGNAIIFSPHPRASHVIKYVLDILIEAGKKSGLPEGAVSYINTVSKEGAAALMRHPCIGMILNSGTPALIPAARESGKPFIYGGGGNGPVFIEKTADIHQAVHDIIESKTFDNGMVSAAEQAIVVERCIESEVREELCAAGAYFMTADEAERLGKLICNEDGGTKSEFVGVSASEIAKRTGMDAGDAQLLIAQGNYLYCAAPLDKDKLCPVITYYIEDDWQNACQKCIELLFAKGGGHTLTIHSNDEYVIEQFALKKPVSRLLINTPATLGGMGMTTDLFPSMILGSGINGIGITSDNVSPMNLINIRTAAYRSDSGRYKSYSSQSACNDIKWQEKHAEEPDMVKTLEKEEIIDDCLQRIIQEVAEYFSKLPS